MANSYQQQVQEATKAIDTIISKMKELDDKIVDTMAKFGKIGNFTSPSGTVEQFKSVTDQMKKLNQVFSEQKEQTNKLSVAKKQLYDIEVTHTTAIQKQIEAMAKNQNTIRETTKEEIKREEMLRKAFDTQEKLSSAFNRLNNEYKIAKNVLRDNIVMYGQLHPKTQQAQKNFDALQKKVNLANKAVSNFNNNSLGGLVSGFRNLIGAFGVVGGVYLFADLARSVFSLTKTLDAQRFALKTVTDDYYEMAEAQRFLAEISNKFGTDLVTTTERYIKFYTAAKQSNVSLKDTEKVFSTVTKAAGVLGLKTHELEGVYLALEQMLSKGKVTTEELRRQLGERLPGAFGIMAKALKVTLPELDKMLKAGEVLSADALPKFAEALTDAYSLDTVDRIETLVAAQNRLKNAWVSFVQGFSSNSKTLVGIIDFIASNLSKIITSVGILSTAWITYKVAVKLSTLQTYLANTAIKLSKDLAIANAAGVNTMTFSWNTFNNALKKNAIFLVIGVLTGLIVVLNKLNRPLSEVARKSIDASRAFLIQKRNTEDLVSENKRLIDRYGELTRKMGDNRDKTKLNNDEQKELNDTMIKLAQNVPSAVVEFDKYGNVLVINTDAVKQFNDEIERLNKQQEETRLAESVKLLGRLKKEQSDLNNLYKEGSAIEIQGLGLVTMQDGQLKKLTQSKGAYGVAVSSTISLTEDELKLVRKAINDNAELLIATENTIAELGGEKSARIQLIETKEEENKQALKSEQLKAAQVKRVAQLRKEIEDLNTVIGVLTKDGYENLDQTTLDYIKTLREAIDVKEKELKSYIGDDTKKKDIEYRHDQVEAIKYQSDAFYSLIANIQRQIAEYEKLLKLIPEGTKEYEYLTDKLYILKGLLEGLDPKVAIDVSEGMKAVEDWAKSYQAPINKIREVITLMDVFKATFDTFGEYYDIDLQKFEFLFDQKENTVKEWADASKELISSVLDANLKKYDIELQEAQRVRDIILNNDLATEEEKRVARQKYEEEEREIKTKRAREERKNTLINIAVDTARGALLAYLSQLIPADPTSIPRAIAAAAATVGFGLAQAAIVSSQPLPKFEKGTNDAPEGWALVDEKRPEVHLDRRDRVKSFGMDRPNLRYFEKGDKVIPSIDEFLNRYNIDDINKVVWNLNMNSNGNAITPNQMDSAILGEISGMRQDMDAMGKRIERLATRPINNKVTVEIEDKRHY